MYASVGTVILQFSEHFAEYQPYIRYFLYSNHLTLNVRNSQYNNMVFTPYAVETETKRSEIQYGPLRGVS